MAASSRDWRALVAPGPLSPAHRMLEGKCQSCHTPLKGVEAKNCLACHGGNDFGDLQSARFHAVAKNCTGCHVEHDGGRSIVKMDHALLMQHRLWAAEMAIKKGAKATSRDPLRSLNCQSCHSNRDPHQGLFTQSCSTCHSLESWSVPEFRHPTSSSRDCASCHKPPPSHLMEHFRMVSQRAAAKQARVDQCQACHTTDSWNNIRARGIYDHH
jgi:hypothetical protein